MKNSLIILLCFAAGVPCSYWGIIPECDDSLSLYILYVMMFLVGIGLGSDLTALSAPIKKYKFQILLIPLSTIVGTIAACCLFSLLAPITAAGATSIDTTLPLISATLGEKYVIFAIFHGIIVDISVPVLIWLLYL